MSFTRMGHITVSCSGSELVSKVYYRFGVSWLIPFEITGLRTRLSVIPTWTRNIADLELFALNNLEVL